MRSLKYILSFILVAFVAVAFQNCSGVSFEDGGSGNQVLKSGTNLGDLNDAELSAAIEDMEQYCVDEDDDSISGDDDDSSSGDDDCTSADHNHDVDPDAALGQQLKSGQSSQSSHDDHLSLEGPDDDDSSSGTDDDSSSAGSRGKCKVDICHLPPGNTDNGQTLSLPVSALKAHLGKHGDENGTDHMGACQ